MQNIVITKATNAVFYNGRSLANLPLIIPAGINQIYYDQENNTGWIENAEGPNTDITSLPDWASKCLEVLQKNLPVPPAPPTPIELCKSEAMGKLQATDWATLPDITTGNPKLLNQDEYFTYRNAVRALAVTPVADPTWPTEPTAQWGN